MKGNCGECGRRWYCEINPDDCNEWPDPVPMNNADKIRSMSDEELADFFRMWCRGMEDCADCHLHYEDCPGSCEFSAWIKWLQQPAEIFSR